MCLWTVTETGRRHHSDKMSVNDWVGVCLMKANSVLLIFFLLLLPSVHLPLHHFLLIHLRADEGVASHKWGGVSRPLFCLYLSIQAIYSWLSFLVRIWILVEAGCVLSTNHGLRLNSKDPLRGARMVGGRAAALRKSFLHICVLRGQQTVIVAVWVLINLTNKAKLKLDKSQRWFNWLFTLSCHFFHTPCYRRTLIINQKKVLIFNPQSLQLDYYHRGMLSSLNPNTQTSELLVRPCLFLCRPPRALLQTLFFSPLFVSVVFAAHQ